MSRKFDYMAPADRDLIAAGSLWRGGSALTSNPRNPRDSDKVQRQPLAARSLVTGRTYLVGLVVPALLHPLFAEVAKALSDVLQNKGYSLIISSSEEDPELEEREINQLLARRLATLIVASCRSTVELFFRIEKQETPYVLIDRKLPGLNANFVGVDDQAVGMIATKYLMDIGCKRIAHIRGPETSPGVQRWEGYKRALYKEASKSSMSTSLLNGRAT